MILLKTNDMRLIPMGKITQYIFEDNLMEIREEYIQNTGEHIAISDWLDCWEKVEDWNELLDIGDDQVNGETLREFMRGPIK